MSAKERKEFDKLELLKQARIAAFQDRMRMAEKHRRGGAPVQSHLRASEQQRLQRQQQHPKTLHQRGVEAIAQIPSAGVITPELDHAERVAAPGQLLSDSV